MCYDQWANVYAQYRVLGCAIRVTPILGDDSGTGLNNTRVVAWISDTATNNSYTSMIDSERPGARIQYCTTGARQAYPIKFMARNHTALGMTKRAYNDDPDTSALYAANPTRNAYLNIIMASITGAAATNDPTLYFDCYFGILC